MPARQARQEDENSRVGLPPGSAGIPPAPAAGPLACRRHVATTMRFGGGSLQARCLRSQEGIFKEVSNPRSGLSILDGAFQSTVYPLEKAVHWEESPA